MGTDKPLISILMAIYEPRMDWLREQLESLEAQSYPNLKLYIRDDCSPTVPYEEIQACVKECIHSFPYVIAQNEKNLGSNLTFERLTREAEGEYFAYCDQDDIWLPEKLSVLQSAIEAKQAELVCSDMYIIDETGKQIADSITHVRRHHVFVDNTSSAADILFHNYVTGCTMLARSNAAQRAVPFCPYMVHDWYIAMCCAETGKIVTLMRPLIQYRIHHDNQTSVLNGVTDKESYQSARIDTPLLRFQWLHEHFSCCEETRERISEGIEWLLARQKNWQHGRGKRTIWKYRHFSLIPSLFEIAANWIPEPLFCLFLSAAKHNLV